MLKFAKAQGFFFQSHYLPRKHIRHGHLIAVDQEISDAEWLSFTNNHAPAFYWSREKNRGGKREGVEGIKWAGSDVEPRG